MNIDSEPVADTPAETGPDPRTLRFVAFEGLVEFHKWADTSGSGQRIWLKLSGREALAHFDKVTKRRGGKGGQVYRCYFGDTDGVLHADLEVDGWFIGAAWHHTTGASITLEVEDLGPFRKYPTQDNSATGEASGFHLTLVQVDEENRAIDQSLADKNAHLETKIKGGPHSKRVAILCQQEDFQRFVAIRLYGVDGAVEERRHASQKQCDEWVKRVVGIKSKIELDHEPATWDRFQAKVWHWFMSWGQNAERRAQRRE